MTTAAPTSRRPDQLVLDTVAAILAGHELPDELHNIDNYDSIGCPIANRYAARIRRQVRRLVAASGRPMPRTGTFLDQ
jgi:hypothetical protein